MNSEDAATRAGKRKHATSGGRKLLRLDAARWQLFERTLPYTTRLKSAPLLHLRAPLASMYVRSCPVYGVAPSYALVCLSFSVLLLLAKRFIFSVERVTRRRW